MKRNSIILSDYQKRRIRTLFRSGVTINALARRHGVSRDRIDNIVSQRMYKPVKG